MQSVLNVDRLISVNQQVLVSERNKHINITQWAFSICRVFILIVPFSITCKMILF